MAKESLYDEARELFLVRIHDGQENYYCFNIPPQTPLNVKSILETGEIVAIRRKGESSKNLDGTSDGHYRTHNSITPIEPDPDLSLEEIKTLIDENLKTAIPAGEWTRYEKPDQPKRAKPAPEPVVYHGKEIFVKDRGTPLFRDQRNCIFCKTGIPGTTRVTIVDGAVKRVQAFAPTDRGAKVVAPFSKHWACSSPACLAKIKGSRKENPQKEVPPLEAVPEGAKEFRTIGAFRFQEHEGRFFYKGNEIILSGDRHYISHKICCSKCGGEIEMKATVSFRDDRPYTVTANRPVFQKEARPEKPKSSKWLCQWCATGEKKPEPFSLKKNVQEDPIPETEAAALAPAATPAPAPSPPTINIPFKDAIRRLEKMAMDASIDDKVFRGAAYMLTLALKEE